MLSPEACNVLAGTAQSDPIWKVHSDFFRRETGTCVEVWGGEQDLAEELVHALLFPHQDNLMHLYLGFAFCKSRCQA